MTEEEIDLYRLQCQMAIESNPTGVKLLIADNHDQLCKNMISQKWEIFLEEAIKAGVVD